MLSIMFSFYLEFILKVIFKSKLNLNLFNYLIQIYIYI